MAALKGHFLHRKAFVGVFVMALLQQPKKKNQKLKVPRETAEKPLPPPAGKCLTLSTLNMKWNRSAEKAGG